MSSLSTCTKHPSTEATGRCKQCGKPFCGQCRVQGPTGYFCSDGCKSSHESFVQRAKQLDDMKSGVNLRLLIRNGGRLLILLLIVSVIAHYYGYDVPLFSSLFEGIIPRAE